LEPRLLLSGSVPGQEIITPVSASGSEVIAVVVGNEVVFQEQTQLDNFFKPNVITFDFPIDPNAVNGRIDITALSDIDSLSETVAFDAEGIVITELFTAPDDGVRPFTATINISDLDLASLAADGNLNLAFTPSAAVDDFGNVNEFVTVGLTYELEPTPLVATPTGLPELGVYRAQISNTFTAPGESARYALTLDTGQSVRFEALPWHELQMQLELLDPTGASIFSWTAPSPGQTLTMQAFDVTTSGDFTLIVTAASGQGEYAVDWLINDRLESESVGGPTNDDFASAEDLSALFKPLPGGGERVVIRGKRPAIVESFENGYLGPGWDLAPTANPANMRVDDQHGASDGTYAFLLNSNTFFSNQYNEANWTVDLSSFDSARLSFDYTVWDDNRDSLPSDFVDFFPGDGVSISDDGVNWHTIMNARTASNGTWWPFSIDLAAEAASAGMILDSDFHIRFTQLDTGWIPTAGYAFDNIVIRQSDQGGIDTDYYKVSLTGGEYVSFSLSDVVGTNVSVNILDATGLLLFEVSESGQTQHRIFSDFLVPSTGDYYIEVNVDPTQDYRLAVVRGATAEIEPNDIPGWWSQAITRTGGAIGGISDPTDVDYYTVSVKAGDVLTLTTATPHDGPAGLNTLDPNIELRFSTGNLSLVASDDNSAPDGRNALLTFDVSFNRTYLIAVSGVGGTAGAYTLTASGFSGTLAEPFPIIFSTIDDGDVINGNPASIDLIFNEDLLPSSIGPEDLTLNGIPSTAVTHILANRKYRFDLPADAFVNNLNMIELAGGAVRDLFGNLNHPFSAEFFINQPGVPTIIESSILEGDSVAPGDLTIVLKFSELLQDPLKGFGGHAGLDKQADEFFTEYNPDTNELTLTYANLTEDVYTFSLPAWVYDPVGDDSYILDMGNARLDADANPLTTVPSGDGNFGGTFEVNFSVVDDSTAPLNLNFFPLEPRGSFAHQAVIKDNAEFLNDTDRFAIDLNSDYFYSFLITPDDEPSLQIEIDLLDSSGGLIATSTGSAPALLNNLSVPVTGVYTLVIRTTGGAGSYTGQVLLNAAFEGEHIGGPTNDDLVSARDINADLITLDGSVRQAVLRGNVPATAFELTETFESGVLGPEWTTTTTSAGGSIEVRSDIGEAEGDFALWMESPFVDPSNNEAIWTVDLTNATDALLTFSYAEDVDVAQSLPSTYTGSQNGDGVSISDDGVTWRTVFNAWNSDRRVWGWRTVNLVYEAGQAGMTLGPNFKIKFQHFEDNVNSPGRRGYDNIRIAGQRQATTPADMYRVGLVAGEHLSVTLKDGAGDPFALELLDSTGQLLAVGAPNWADADALINGFIADADGDYYIRVVSDNLNYTLIATLDAGFAPETSLKLPLGATGRLVSAIGSSTSDIDQFTLSANAGDVLSLWTTTPQIGAAASFNTPDTFLELFDPGNTLVASGGTSGDGVNALINHTAGLTGIYTVRVSSELNTRGGYVLHTTGQTGTPPPFDVTFSTLFDGEAVKTVPTQVTFNFSHPIRLDTLTAADLTIDSVAAAGVTVDDPDTLTFDLPAGLIEGAHDLVIASDALASLTGDLLEPFAARFTIDTVAPRVIDVSIQENDVIQPGPLEIVVRFDEEISIPFNPTSLDVVLSPQFTGFSSLRPDSVSYDPVASVLTLGFNDVQEDLYQLRLDSNTFSSDFHDLAGNPLDGETPVWPIPPNISGNSVPGGDFVVNFVVDRVAPSPIASPHRNLPPSPLASASLNNQGMLTDVTDTDPFTVFLQTGQSITAVLTPVDTFLAVLTLSGPEGVVTAPDFDMPVVLNYTHTGPAGDVLLTVGADDLSDTFVDYDLDIHIGTTFEQYLAPVVGGSEPVLDLNPAFVGVPGSDVDVATVHGELLNELFFDDVYTFDLQAGQVLTVTVDSNMSTATAELIDPTTGSVLTSGSVNPSFDQVIVDFIAPTTGRYDLRVDASAEGSYRLTVIRGATLDLKPDTTSGDPPLALDVAGAALGSLRTLGAERLYALSNQGGFGSPGRITELDPTTLSVVNTFETTIVDEQFGSTIRLTNITYDGQYLYGWSSFTRDVVYILDPDTGDQLGSLDIRAMTGAFLASDIGSYRGELVVVLSNAPGSLVFIEPSTRQITRQLPTGLPRITAVAGAVERGSIFVENIFGPLGFPSEFHEIDAETGTIINSFPGITGTPIQQLAYADGHLFAPIFGGESIIVLDPDTLAEIPVAPSEFVFATSLGGDGVAPIQDADRYTLSLLPGAGITLSTGTPFDHPAGLPLNSLDPAIRVLDPNGVEVAFDDNGQADGKNSLLTFSAVAGGVYTIAVSAVSGTGEYLLNIDRTPFLFGDLNGDGFIGIADLNAVLGNWNQTVPVGDLVRGDASGDGFIGIEDLNAVLGNWNATLPEPVVEGDLTDDGFVGIADLNLVLGNWNTDGSGDTRSDPTGDGFVGIGDLNLVLGNWNTGTPPTSTELTLMLQESASQETVEVATTEQNVRPASQSRLAPTSSSVTDSTGPRRSTRGRRLVSQFESALDAVANDRPSNSSLNQRTLTAMAEWSRRQGPMRSVLGQDYTPWSLRGSTPVGLLGLWDDTEHIL
jgi:Bacterial pre-peptidase C-terminal domain